MAVQFTNSTPLSVATMGPASLYPSPITPTGLTGVVSSVTVRLNGYHWGHIADTDILLVAPNGVAAVVMSDACSLFQTTAPANLAFSDSFVLILPPTGCAAIPLNTKPNNNQDALMCLADPDVFPAPAPAGPSAGGYPVGPQLFSVFNGMSAATAMGEWKLFVFDDCFVDMDGGSIDNGWTLELTTSPTAVTVLAFSARTAKGGVRLTWTSASESDVAGYNVYRRGPSRTIKLNRSLIKAHGLLGATYRLLDAKARQGVDYTYRLQIVHKDGSRSWDRTVRSAA